ncbi:hypothetical protein Gotur_012520 [Gossypium turneri]
MSMSLRKMSYWFYFCKTFSNSHQLTFSFFLPLCPSHIFSSQANYTLLFRFTQIFLFAGSWLKSFW